jgi:hypothetical protein
MMIADNQHQTMNDPANHQNAREIAGLVRKLRWIGDDDGARQLELKLLMVQEDSCILTSPSDTD